MCWLCDHPEATPEDYLAVVRQKARENGWMVQFVEADPHPFAYTVGLTAWEQPELLVTGLPPASSCWLLRSVIQESLLGFPLAPGSRTAIDGGPEVELVEVDHPEVHLCWAVNHAQRPGHGCQPVLGVRSRAA